MQHELQGLKIEGMEVFFRQICNHKNKDVTMVVLQGDGGAPLVCQTNQGFTVVGLVAWGIGCAEGNVPGVYVNVANFVNFIERHTG